MNFDGSGSPREELSREDEGFDLEGGAAWVEIDLDDEPNRCWTP